MDDKNNIFSGESELILWPQDTEEVKGVPIVANSLTYSEDDDCEPIVKPAPLLFSMDTTSSSKDWFTRLMAGPINKPRNLKYPNKKRPVRVQRKWFNRYVKPRVRSLALHTGSGQMLFFPHLEPRFSLDGLTFKAIAKPSKRNTRLNQIKETK